MESLSLTAVADEQLARARESSSGRSAQTIYGGHEHFLRQTVIALIEGHELSEHYGPGEGTLQVLQGQGTVSAGDDRFSVLPRQSSGRFALPHLRRRQTARSKHRRRW